MKKSIIRTLALAVTTAASFTSVDDAVAQNGNAFQQFPEEYKIVGNANNDTLIVKVLYENAPNYFGAPDKKEFQNIVKILADKHGIHMEEQELLLEANKWELSHGGLSGRTAQQFIDYLLGK